MDLITKDLGEVDLAVKIENKMLTLEANYPGATVGATVKIIVDAKILLQKIKDVIPGNIDNVVIDILETQIP